MLFPARVRGWLCAGFALCAAVLLLLRLTLPQDASPEYDYTVRQLFQRAFLPAVLVALLSCPFFKRFSGLSRRQRVWQITGVLAVIFFVLPLVSPPVRVLPWRLSYVLSASWALGMLCLSVFTFLAAAACRKSLAAGLLSLAASLFLALFCMEGYLLLTPQVADGLVDDSRHSKYVLSGQATVSGSNFRMTSIGYFPAALGHPGATAQRTLKFDRELFDVRYGYDARGRRETPADNGDPKAELLLFGCSYTFGHGLENEETWAWRLGSLLGPEWRVSNYANNGFGAHQMLSLLEEKAVEPPVAPARASIFLAIEHHLRRNAGLTGGGRSVRYALRDGQLARDGFTDEAYRALFRIPQVFNGSQLASQVSFLAEEAIVKREHAALEETYLAIIEKSARLLREEYKAPLTVLLWPDVARLEPELRRRGIATLQAHAMLPDWDATAIQGDAYLIDPGVENHPNPRATRELAEGLAAYFRSLPGFAGTP